MLKATFQADFSSFQEAVAKAELSLKSFEGNANKVGSSLNKMADSLSGRKLIQDATLMSQAVEKIGGPAKLTANELQRVSAQASEAVAKMKALGVDVPPKIQALADKVQPLPTAFSKVSSVVTALGGALGLVFTGTAILNGIKNQITAAMNYADSLAFLKAKTELSYRDLQVLEDVGISTGVSIESLAGAVQILQMRLGDGTARKGIQALGLSFGDLLRMSPAEQLTKIGAAIALIEDPTERAKVAAQVFGRTWKEILPALKANMAEAAKSAKIVGDSQIDAADRAGDRWSKFWSDQKRGWTSWAGNILLNWEHVSNKKAEFDKKMAGGLPTLPGAPGARIGGGNTINDVDPAMISNLRVYGKTLDETARSSVQLAEATKKATDAREKFLEMSKAAAGSEFEWQNQILLTKFKMSQLVVEENTLYEQTRTLADFVASHKGEMFPEPPQDALDKWKQAQRTIEELPPRVSTLDKTLDRLAESFAQLGQIGGDSLSNVAREIGTVIAAMSAAEDAGEDMRAGFKKGGAEGYSEMAVAAIAAVGAIDAATNSTEKYKNVLGGAAAGAAAGSKIFPVVGTAIGAAAGALAGWWKSNRMEGKTVSPLRDEFFKMAGGLEKLNPEVMRLTGNLTLVQAVFDARTVEEYNAAVKELGAVLVAGSALAKQAGLDIESITTKLAGIPVLTPEVKAALEAAFNAKNPADYAAALRGVIGILDEQAGKQKFLDETLKKYGLTWTDLGKQARDAQVAVTSAEIEREFRALEEAGVDVNNIMRHMGGSINDFVLKAKKSGTEVPESFRDVIQTAIDAGEMFTVSTEELKKLKEEAEKLGKPFDDSKYKITSVKDAGILFGTTMEEATKKVGLAIERLITLLEERLGPAIKNIPDAEVEIRGRYIPPKNMPDMPVIEMARGGSGMVKKPTLFLAGEAGSEEFAFSGAGKKFGGGGGGATVYDFSELKEEMARLRADQDRDRRRLPHLLSTAVRDAFVQAG